MSNGRQVCARSDPGWRRQPAYGGRKSTSVQPETASAERVVGQIIFVRVFGSETVGGVPMARFEIRVVGTCIPTGGDGIPTPEGGMFIRVRSGRLDGVFAEINGISFKNAYSTALAASLTGNTILVDNVPNCTDDVQTINSPAGVGMRLG